MPMRITQLTPDEAIASLRSSPAGLSLLEAQRRLGEYGANRVVGVRRASLALRFAREFTHFFALILWLAAGLAMIAELNNRGGGMLTLALAIVGVIVVNGVFSFWQEYRTERLLAALARLLPHQVRVVRNGVAHALAAAELVPGDIILLQEGDDVPADCRVLDAYGLRVNTATITGEALPKARRADPAPEENLIHARNLLLAGTAIVAGEARALVFATGMHTEFGRIARLTQETDEEPSPLQREIAWLSRLVAALATGLGALFFFIGQIVGLSFWENFIFAIGVIVALVPEGLLPTVTLSLAFAAQRMARRNALVRHLPAVETLGSATVICTDKTGTLTQNQMSVAHLFADGRFADPAPDAARGAAPRELLEGTQHCNSLKRVEIDGVIQTVGDPMEVALARFGSSALAMQPLPRVDELPFDADRKRMSTVHTAPRGKVLYCKGAPETVLPLCRSVATAEGAVALDEARLTGFLAAQREMAARGLRVLAFAHRTLPDGVHHEHWEHDLTVSGLIGLRDPPRAEVPDAARRCRDAGIRVIMLTGDHPETARALAFEIGLASSHAPHTVTGDELRRLSDTQLQLVLDEPEILFARVSADQKLRIVNALKRKGHVVAVTGDGVNDAPALKAGDIGIAMGVAGTDVARESADLVLLDDNFASIVAAIEEGRAVFDNIRKFMTYILTHNVPELVPYLAFVLFKIPLPLTVIQILAIDLGTDTLPALALGAERPDPAVMRRPPRARDDRLLSWGLLARAFLFLGPIQAAAALAAYFFVLDGGGWGYGTALAAGDTLYREATTACLAAIVVMQIANVFLCRHPRESVFASGSFSNTLILWGIATELILIALIVYTPWGNAVFGTAPIGAQVWLFIVPFAAAMLVLEEGRKALVRRHAAAWEGRAARDAGRP